MILIHVTFQTGFCTFVLSNYMKTLPKELIEAAMMDGAGVFTIYRRVILPLCTPAIAALATLLHRLDLQRLLLGADAVQVGRQAADHRGPQQPVGRVLHRSRRSWRRSRCMAAIPTIVIYLVLQRCFVSGLTLGSAKG